MAKRTELYSRPELKERGWSDSTIDRLMPQPDDFRDNPHYKCAAPMKFYLIARVEELERSSDSWRKNRKRSSASIGVAERKREETLSWVRGLEIGFDLPSRLRSLPALAREAIEHRNLISECYPDGQPRRDFSAASFYDGCWEDEHVQRWMLNYLRHACTDYEKQLNTLFGKVGTELAYELLRSRINDAAESMVFALTGDFFEFEERNGRLFPQLKDRAAKTAPSGAKYYVTSKDGLAAV